MIPDQHVYIDYRGYQIDQRKRYNKKLDGWRTYGYYIGKQRYDCLTEVQKAIDQKVEEHNECRFWKNWEESNYD